MNKEQLNQILGIVYIICGLILFFYITGAFILQAGVALAALYLVYRGLKIRNYPMSFSRFLFMFQQFRSRF